MFVKKCKDLFSRRKLTKNWGVLNNFYRKNILHSDQSSCLATEWDVPSSLLIDSGLGWDGEAYTIPMYNDFLNITGIQRRFPNGNKRMVEGSKLGIFLGWNINRWPEQGCSPFVICEGYSDTITATYYGYYSIGRPSCGTGIDDTLNVLKLFNRKNVVIIADPDEVGQWGAELLLRTLFEKNIKSSIILPPAGIKDLREWKTKGLTKEQFDEHIRIANS